MPVIVIPHRVVSQGAPVPELNGFMDARLWSMFCADIRNVVGQGDCIACAIEWGVCCVTGIWCIFFCHPCIAGCINGDRVRQECNKFNAQHYGGRPVFSAGPNSSIMVNTDMMGQSIALVPVPTQLVYPGGQPQMAYPGSPPQMAYPGGQPQPYPAYPPVAQASLSPVGATMPGYQSVPTAQPISPMPPGGPHVMNVVVPAGVVPGSMLTVATPDGQTIQVTVPDGIVAGQEFKVQY